MPDPRQFASIRSAWYDDPPATADTSLPPTHRRRLLNFMDAARDDAREPVSPHVPLPIPTADASRRVYVAPSTRRRRRSESMHEDDDPRSPVGQLPAPHDYRNRRFKRRRLDATPPALPRTPIKYGHYGQVEPGRLKMELVSCDGGEHRDPRHPATSLGPENLLRHDKSVYCSERPSSNIILRHADDTPFCLEKLHIVGPDDDFTAPVREGVVHVAMTIKDLEKYLDPPPHARRAVVHPAAPDPRQQRGEPIILSSPEQLSLSDALRDPQINAVLETRIESTDSHQNEDPRDAAYLDHAFSFDPSDLDIHCDISHMNDRVSLTSSSSNSNNVIHPDRPLTILCDEDPGPEDSSPQDVLDYRLHRLNLARRRLEVSRFDSDGRWSSGLVRIPNNVALRERERDSGGAWGLNALMARSGFHSSPTSPEPTRAERPPRHTMPPSPTIHHVSSKEEIATGKKDANVTSASFHIKPNKHHVAIHFSPPVSGRFILLKVWANASNVDVQSVILKGFGGGRFFPAVCPR